MQHGLWFNQSYKRVLVFTDAFIQNTLASTT